MCMIYKYIVLIFEMEGKKLFIYDLWRDTWMLTLIWNIVTGNLLHQATGGNNGTYYPW